MAESDGFEPPNLFLDQTAFKAVPFANTVDSPFKTNLIICRVARHSMDLFLTGPQSSLYRAVHPQSSYTIIKTRMQ